MVHATLPHILQHGEHEFDVPLGFGSWCLIPIKLECWWWCTPQWLHLDLGFEAQWRPIDEVEDEVGDRGEQLTKLQHVQEDPK